MAQSRIFRELIASLEPEIRQAFLSGVEDLSNNIDWAALIDSLQRGDIDAAIAALNIDDAAWSDLSSALTSAYEQSGREQIKRIPGAGIGVRFKMSDPRAQKWMSEHVADFVVGITNEQITLVRQVIGEAFAEGRHPRETARTIAGRVINGRRTGGIIGLDNPRADRYIAVSEGMKTSEGVRALVIEKSDGALSVRYKVNRSTEKRILSAYREGTAVPERGRIISEQQYYNALLKHRADTIAETETGNAVMAARDEAWNQALDSKGMTRADVIKTWQHRRGASRYHRPDHLAMSGVSVRGMDTPFVFPDGVEMMHAHDPDAPASHIIRCGCSTEYRISRNVPKVN